MANDRKKKEDDVAFLMAQDDDSNDDYAKLAENTKSDDVAFVGCLFWVLSFILTPFFYFKGIAYFSDVVYPAGFWAAAIVPWIAFSIGGSIASAVVIYQLGVRAVWTMFKRTFLKRKTDSDFEDLLKGTVPIFLAAYFVGIALVAIPSALILASTTGLPIGVTTLEMLVYCSLVCGFAAVPYMTATIG